MVSGSFTPRSAELQPLAAAQIVIAFPDMQIAVADAGRQDLQQDLVPVGFGVGRSISRSGAPHSQTS